MTQEAFEVLRAAVNLARSESVERVSFLRRRLVERGYAAAHVDAALQYWANREAELGDPRLRGYA